MRKLLSDIERVKKRERRNGKNERRRLFSPLRFSVSFFFFDASWCLSWPECKSWNLERELGFSTGSLQNGFRFAQGKINNFKFSERASTLVLVRNPIDGTYFLWQRKIMEIMIRVLRIRANFSLINKDSSKRQRQSIYIRATCTNCRNANTPAARPGNQHKSHDNYI